MRRTVTFERPVFEAIQQERAKLLLKGKERNFTEMVNDLLKKALNLMNHLEEEYNRLCGKYPPDYPIPRSDVTDWIMQTLGMEES